MCTYITGVLPASVDLPKIRATGRALGLSFESVENPHVHAQLGDGEIYVRITGGHCDCGTALGSSNRPQNKDANPAKMEREIRNLRKKGWSEAKIIQSVANRQQAQEKNRRAEQTHAVLRIPHAQQWLDILNRLIDSGVTPRLGLLLHWYSKSLESERIRITSRKMLDLLTLEPQTLLDLEEDVLYEFVKTTFRSKPNPQAPPR